MRGTTDAHAQAGRYIENQARACVTMTQQNTNTQTHSDAQKKMSNNNNKRMFIVLWGVMLWHYTTSPPSSETEVSGVACCWGHP